MNDYQDSKSVRITKGSRLLQAKVGKGSIAPEKISVSQQMIERAGEVIDFLPMAKEHLDALEQALNESSSANVPIDRFTKPVMQLKANASMFNYNLVGDLTNIMLNFLEAVDDTDPDVVEIVDAHYKTLKHLVDNKLSGKGGEYGKELRAELKAACRRYFSKQDGAAASAKEAFFVD